MLQHGLYPDHCTQTSIDFAKHRRKHTTPRADHPLRGAVAKPVDTQQRSVLIPQCQSCARIRDVTCAMPPAHRAGTPARHKTIHALLCEEGELHVPAVAATSK